ncbi:MAG: glutamine-synthetase adenylyltransferase [Rhodobacteraceae bacterium]|nr:glutamine-synthetase adenylyltransferase [Paracoccaceae bacterium]
MTARLLPPTTALVSTPLSARLTRAPRPFDRPRAAEVAGRVAPAATPLGDLIEGAAGCSPYLHGLILRETDWLVAALDADPDAVIPHLLAEAFALPPDALDAGLRTLKRRAALWVALMDLGGAWPLETVTAALTRTADLAVDLALRTHVATEVRRGRLPDVPADDPAAGGLVALAMGKMGALELNYSSDIDVIVLFDGARHARHFDDARAAFIRATRRLTATLSDLTADGYVFRTDLRLRPDAAVTPVAMSVDAAESYYESLGRTWERAAYIKARPCAGDTATGDAFLRALTPFVWRKHLDFAAIQDAHDMRLRIRDAKRLHGLSLPGHNLKLGAGGIREIEFFTQTRQLIAGGRDPSLRVRGTVDGLARLAAAGWVPQDIADRLTDDYRAHRTVEHRLQMIADAQTHDLPATDDGFARLAAFMDRDDGDLRRDLRERFARVHDLTEGFFAPGQSATPVPAFDLTPEMERIVARWQTYPALRSDRAQALFRRIRPEFLRRLSRAADPLEALIHLDEFLRSLPAGVQLFALFDANPALIDLIVDIAATAPRLARYLGRNAAVLDAVIGGGFFAGWRGQARLTGDLARMLDTVPDYERRLDAARRWAKEVHFRIGVHHLRGLIGADEAGHQYADLACACVASLWPVVVAQFAQRHGPPPGRGAAVLGMGSLGARRLSAGSDLDLIVIYDAAGQDASDGPRPLAARSYYARLTQALVTALSAPMAEGRLYEVDMRLRPSGRQGPVATSLDAFRDYQMREAWTWEHLALTRARVLAGDPGVAGDLDAFRTALMAQPRDRARTLADVADMRARLAAARAPAGPLDAKLGPGRLLDIDLTVQTGALIAGSAATDPAAQVAAARACGWLSDAQAEALTAAHDLFWTLQAATRLLTDATLDPATVGQGGTAFLLRETRMDDAAALVRAATARATAAAAVADALVVDSGRAASEDTP